MNSSLLICTIVIQYKYHNRQIILEEHLPLIEYNQTYSSPSQLPTEHIKPQCQYSDSVTYQLNIKNHGRLLQDLVYAVKISVLSNH